MIGFLIVGFLIVVLSFLITFYPPRPRCPVVFAPGVRVAAPAAGLVRLKLYKIEGSVTVRIFTMLVSFLTHHLLFAQASYASSHGQTSETTSMGVAMQPIVTRFWFRVYLNLK